VLVSIKYGIYILVDIMIQKFSFLKNVSLIIQFTLFEIIILLKQNCILKKTCWRNVLLKWTFVDSKTILMQYEYETLKEPFV